MSKFGRFFRGSAFDNMNTRLKILPLPAHSTVMRIQSSLIIFFLSLLSFPFRLHVSEIMTLIVKCEDGSSRTENKPLDVVMMLLAISRHSR